MNAANSKAIVRSGYNAIAQSYLATRSLDTDDVRLLPELVKRLPKNARVLDAGCGAGIPVTKILAEQFDVIGVDFSETQIQIARMLVSQAEFLCADIVDLGFPDECFDAICSYYAIIHVPREEHARLLANYFRMLKPGGLALMTMGRGDTPGDVEENWLGARMYWSHYGAATNLKMIQDCGFEIVWTRVVADSLDKNASHFFVLGSKSAAKKMKPVI